MRLRILLAILMLLSALGARAAGTDSADPTARFRTIYAATLKKYETEYRGGSEAWTISYIKTLKALQVSKQKSGDLDGWSAANRELNRFEKELVLPKDIVSESTGDLHTVQERYLKQQAELEDKKHRQVLALKKNYTARLVDIQTELTKAGDFDAAFKAKAEIERVEAAPEVVEAEAYLASAADGQPEKQPVATTAPSPEPTATTGRANKPITGANTLEDGSIIHPLCRHPPNDSSMVFKRASLSRTSRSPLAGGISTTCWIGSKKSSSTRSSSDSYYSSRTKSRTDDRSIRLAIRSSRPGRQTEVLRAHVQYFSRPMVKTTGHVAPSMFTEKMFELPHLDSRAVYVDLVPVSISSTRYSSSSYYGSSSTSHGGSQFYGCIITIATPKGEILSQETTTSQLKSYAPTPEKLTAAAKKDAAKRALEEAYVEVRRRKEEYYQDLGNPAKRDAYRAAQERIEQLNKIVAEGR